MSAPFGQAMAPGAKEKSAGARYPIAPGAVTRAVVARLIAAAEEQYPDHGSVGEHKVRTERSYSARSSFTTWLLHKPRAGSLDPF